VNLGGGRLDGWPPPFVYSPAMTNRGLAPFALALFASALFSLSCDKATPVAPDGTTLSMTANPSRISLRGSSTITVVGRKPTGQPLDPGTEIRLSSDRGTISAIAVTDATGTATATLQGDGRAGAATVTASVGAMTMTTAMVQIGESAETKPTVLLSVSPNSVEINKTATVTVIARNSDGTPVAAGQPVILTTTLGTLSPSRPTTRSDGTATSTVNAGILAGSATIAAIVGTSDQATTTLTIRGNVESIFLDAQPRTIVSGANSVITLTASLVNTSGQGVSGVQVTFTSPIGTLDETSVVTNSSGLAVTRLRVSGNVAAANYTLTARAPDGGGQILDSTTTITVQSPGGT
jgi:Invasin, domain 3